MKLDLTLHLDHLLNAAPEDQPALLRRIAAIAFSEGADAGLEWIQTDPDILNPYSETSTEPGATHDH